MSCYLPKSVLITVFAILCIPALAYSTFQSFYPMEPDTVYTKHDQLKIEWQKFSAGENFTEYLAKERYFDEDALTADILVLRNFKEPQRLFYQHARVSYSSFITRETVNCRNRTVTIQDLMMFSKPLTKGELVNALYDLNWDTSEAQPNTMNYLKVTSFCRFAS